MGLALPWLAAAAGAHPLAPSLLELRELAPGRLEVSWKTPLAVPVGAELAPVLPEGCQRVGEPRMALDESSATLRFRADCAGPGLVGSRVGVRGLAESRTEALLRVELADGRSLRAVLSADASEWTIPDRQRPLGVAEGYGVLGFWHILEGLDHLLFVLGLVLLVPDRRRLVGTISAFTVGHSVTLSLAVLGFVGIPQPLAELAIAGSILALALELVREGEGRPPLLGRFPWLMAGLFGLLHGLGFAGALSRVGLPQQELPLALFSFNLGIEAGQLLFVGAVLLAGAALRPVTRAAPAWLSRLPAYGIGTLAAYWCFARAAGTF